MPKVVCCCPHPEERGAEIMPPTRMRMRASRRMRTSQSMRPHASRRRASHASVRALRELACAARLLSTRAGADGGLAKRANESYSGSCTLLSLARGSAGATIFDVSREPTCGCRKRCLERAPCFRPVLYRELCNENVWGVVRLRHRHVWRQAQYPAASAPRVRLSAAPMNPVGVTRIELADVRGKPSTTVWPRALSASIRSRGNPCSTATSSGNH